MPSRHQAGENNRGAHRLGILAILALQIAVLLAVSGAAIVYVDWSSSAAQAEFMRAIESASGPGHHAPPPALQPVKDRKACARKA
ncbi:hypothetical protein [Bradyrhizobium sp.]|jgi:hypothetical protein|uniref:hypothetical protein n=1 Tax=Bradyrhizobium sp. TaxID=376 RepID=UPI002E00923A|nr:hypothetical protein [Bradyrhizobium sp.]